MPNIITKIEVARGCGYRVKGAKYFIAEGLGMECGKLPIAVIRCDHCGQGVKPARGFSWITTELFSKAKCTSDKEQCAACPMNQKKQRMGLIWIGEKFYASPRDFTNEAAMIGISRRISQIPKDFVLNKTWIAVGHRKAIQKFSADNTPIATPGIFHAFKPSRIEYVVKGDETEERLEALEKRGFTLVNVIRDVDAQKTLDL